MVDFLSKTYINITWIVMVNGLFLNKKEVFNYVEHLFYKYLI